MSVYEIHFLINILKSGLKDGSPGRWSVVLYPTVVVL